MSFFVPRRRVEEHARPLPRPVPPDVATGSAPAWAPHTPATDPADAALEPFGEPVWRPAWLVALRAGRARLMAWLRAHRDAQRLHALDDRLLADMGISRGRIDAAVRDGDLHSRKGERR